MKIITSEGRIIEHKTFRFPGGETQVRVDSLSLARVIQRDVVIHTLLHSADTVMELLLATDALRRMLPTNSQIKLVCPYLPYARQDRVCYYGEALSLRVMCDLINAQRYETVEVWDVHSDVALALLDRVKNVPASHFVWDQIVAKRTNMMVLVAPDKGAVKRVNACVPPVEPGEAHWLRVVQADKIRDPNDGSIVGTKVDCDHIGSADFLMVDDLCDGGRTFIELAKVLRPLTMGKIYLYVTHGIFSAGFNTLRDHIDKIYTANSFVNVGPLGGYVKVLGSDFSA